MPSKPKNPQKETLDEISGRDLFQTPNYAVDLLVPFIPESVGVIWECAAGLGKIARRLLYYGYGVAATDLSQGINFLVNDPPEAYDAIVTNPPFSLKKKFYEMCKGYGLPFALLIPADYSQWTIEAVKNDGAEKIIPTRRIDYITPNILVRIHENEILETFKSENKGFDLTLVEMKEHEPYTWGQLLLKHRNFCKWDSIYDVPAMFLKKYSSSYYHSMWLCEGFNIGKSETFVELSKADKLNI